MTFQAYLDTIEKKTGLTPRELLTQASERGFAGPGVKAGEVIAWLAEDYGLGRGHAMAIVQLIKNGANAETQPGDADCVESDAAWLDGIATRPAS